MSRLRTMKRLLGFFGSAGGRYVSGLLGMGLVSYFVNVGLALTMAWFTHSVLARDAPRLALSVLGIVSVGVMAAVLIYLCSVAMLQGAIRGEQGLRSALLRKVLSMSSAELAQRRAGDLLSRVNSDIAQTAKLYRRTLQSAADVVLNGLASTLTLLIFDWRAALLALACGVVTLLLTVPFMGPLERQSRVLQERQGSYLRLVGQLMRGAAVLRRFRLGAAMLDRIQTEVGLVQRAGTRMAVTEAFQSSTDAVALVVSMSLIVYGGFRSMEDISFLPKLMALLQLGNGTLALFSHLTSLLGGLPVQMAAAERILEVLDLPDEPQRWLLSPGSATSSSPAPAGLTVTALSFSYGSTPALTDLHFSLAPGERAVLVGRSGSGKSTLFKILLGLHPPAAGRVTMDGADLHTTALDDWRRQIAYVPQNAFLFRDTIYANILGGMADAGAAAVEQAARMARAHDFIVDLPDGYQTLLAEGAVSLSSGQRQRIAIARAFLQDAPVLLLDEPTAALDSENEKQVLDALRTLIEGRITLLISHRASALGGADLVLTLDDGRLLPTSSEGCSPESEPS